MPDGSVPELRLAFDVRRWAVRRTSKYIRVFPTQQPCDRSRLLTTRRIHPRKVAALRLRTLPRSIPATRLVTYVASRHQLPTRTRTRLLNTMADHPELQAKLQELDHELEEGDITQKGFVSICPTSRPVPRVQQLPRIQHPRCDLR